MANIDLPFNARYGITVGNSQYQISDNVGNLASVNLTASGALSVTGTSTLGVVNASGGVTAAAINSNTSLTFGVGGSAAAGSIYSDINWGCRIAARQASPLYCEFAFVNASGTPRLLVDPNGNTLVLQNLSVTGPTIFGQMNQGSYGFTQGAIGYQASQGLIVAAKTGTALDFCIINPANNAYIMTVPTGTTDVHFTGASYGATARFGTNNTQLATTSFVQQAVQPASLFSSYGNNPGKTVYTGSNATPNVYYNTTGKVLFVGIMLTQPSPSTVAATLNCYVNGIHVNSGYCIDFQSAWASNGYVAFFVPSGASYYTQWANNIGGTIWYESY